jgi:hypothetical protein
VDGFVVERIAMVMPRRNHQTETFERLNKELAEAKETHCPNGCCAAGRAPGTDAQTL